MTRRAFQNGTLGLAIGIRDTNPRYGHDLDQGQAIFRQYCAKRVFRPSRAMRKGCTAGEMTQVP